MMTPLLALFVRSLREDMRARATYWMRGMLCGFLGLVLLALALGATWSNAPGRELFSFIISFQLLAITIIGLSYFTSAIAEEKEEQTLGLLRMTGLSPLSILLGKSTSRLCSALLLLVAMVPFTIYAITLGGVSLRQVAAGYCTLGAFTFLLCNLALLGSVLMRRTGGAVAFCLAWLWLIVFTGPLLWLLAKLIAPLIRFGPALNQAGDALWSTTPIERLRQVLETGFHDNLAGIQVATDMGLGVVCFLLAWAAFESFSNRGPDTAAAASVVQRKFLGIKLSRPPRPWAQALMWKDFYFLCGGHLGFALRTLGYGSALVPYLIRADSAAPTISIFGQLFFFVLPFVFSLDAGAMAARIYRTEIRDQTLSVLATLPMSIRQIARRKAVGCLIAASPGLVGTAATQLVAVSSFHRSGPGFIGTTAGTGGSFGLGIYSDFAFMAVQFSASWVNILLLVFLVAWLSLHMKQGALAVGYVLKYAFGSMVSIAVMSIFAMGAITNMAGRGSGSANFNGWSLFILTPIITMLVSLVAVFVLRHLSLRRLEALVGES